jgi:hypothetical protein
MSFKCFGGDGTAVHTQPFPCFGCDGTLSKILEGIQLTVHNKLVLNFFIFLFSRFFPDLVFIITLLIVFNYFFFFFDKQKLITFH